MILMKAQVSVEFFLLFTIIITIFSIIMFFSIEMQRQVDYISKYNKVVSIALEVGNAVDTVVSNQVNMIINIPYGYRIEAISGAIIVTDLITNVSASWPVSHININSSVPDNSTLLNISLVNSTVYII